MKEKYVLSNEEFKKAEESMTDEQKLMSAGREKIVNQEDLKDWIDHMSNGGLKFWQEQSQAFRNGKIMIELSDLGIGSRGDRKMMTDGEAIELLKDKDWKKYFEKQKEDRFDGKGVKLSGLDLFENILKRVKELKKKNIELGNIISQEDMLKATGRQLEYADWELSKGEAEDRIEKKLIATESN